MPKRALKKVSMSGCCTLPLSLSAPNTRSASAVSFTLIESEKPWKLGLPMQWPSEAMIIASPTRKDACITLSAGGVVGPIGSGLSLKRISISICAPSALR
jgi:hypothetical protein